MSTSICFSNLFLTLASTFISATESATRLYYRARNEPVSTVLHGAGQVYFIPPQQCAHVRDKKALLGRNEIPVAAQNPLHFTLPSTSATNQIQMRVAPGSTAPRLFGVPEP